MAWRESSTGKSGVLAESMKGHRLGALTLALKTVSEEAKRTGAFFAINLARSGVESLLWLFVEWAEPPGTSRFRYCGTAPCRHVFANGGAS